MATLIEKLRQLLRQKIKSDKFGMDQTPASTSAPGAYADVKVTTTSELQKLMVALANTQDEEYSCAETFAILDEYVEIAVQNEKDAVALMPLVKHHLDTCPGCHEQFEALLTILENDFRR